MTGRARAACLVLAGVLSPAAAAATEPYSVEGPGRTPCADHAASTDARARDRVGSWLTGYLTAHQRLMPDTFDLTPWQTPSILLGLLDQYCAANGTATVEDGARELVAYLAPRAMSEPARAVAVGEADAFVLVYEPVLHDIRARLSDRGHPPGASARSLAEALRAYQKTMGLNPTGLPDQATLVLLME